MSFEFNGLSRSGVLCGEDFIRYRPFKDSPEEILAEEEFDWGALWRNVAIGLGFVTLVTGAVAYCATIAFTGGASAVFAPYVMGGLTAVGGSWLVVSQAEKDYARGEVSGTMTYINSALAGSASGALAGYAFCMAPYAAPALLYGTGAAVTVTAGLSNSDYYVKNNQVAHFEQVPRAGEGGTGSKFQEVFDLADNYTLSDNTFNNHIPDRHGPNSSYGNKSHFNLDFDIIDGINSTLTGSNFVVGSNTAGREGYIFEQTFTNPVGVNSKGKPLYTLKVVIDEAGNIITAFPKK